MRQILENQLDDWLARTKVSECGMRLYCVCTLDSFLRVDRVCLTDGSGRRLAVFSGPQTRSTESWLSGNWLRLLGAGAGEAQLSHLATDTEILKPQRAALQSPLLLVRFMGPMTNTREAIRS